MGIDDARAGRGGVDMLVRGAVVMTKGDLMEFDVSFGLPSTSSNLRPCPACAWHAGTSWREALECSDPENTTFVLLTTHAQYDAACSRCELEVWVTEAHHRELSPLLHYDKRTTQNSAFGRCILHDYPPLNLCAFDRLEPSVNLVNVGKWEDLADFPVRLIFWRCSRESVARHRNPLWDPTIGLTLESLYFDILHTLHLGVSDFYGEGINLGAH